MKFWDASAIVPLLVAERTTRSLQALANRDSDLLVWWGSQVECASALARLERGALLDVKGAALAFDRLKQLANGWHEIEPSEIIRENALRFLRVHPLRAADALQLAAAFIAAERRPSSLEVVTLDDRFAEAAPFKSSKASRSRRAIAEAHSTCDPHHTKTSESPRASACSDCVVLSATSSGTIAEASQNFTAPPGARR